MWPYLVVQRSPNASVIGQGCASPSADPTARPARCSAYPWRPSSSILPDVVFGRDNSKLCRPKCCRTQSSRPSCATSTRQVQQAQWPHQAGERQAPQAGEGEPPMIPTWPRQKKAGIARTAPAKGHVNEEVINDIRKSEQPRRKSVPMDKIKHRYTSRKTNPFICLRLPGELMLGELSAATRDRLSAALRAHFEHVR